MQCEQHVDALHKRARAAQNTVCTLLCKLRMCPQLSKCACTLRMDPQHSAPFTHLVVGIDQDGQEQGHHSIVVLHKQCLRQCQWKVPQQLYRSSRCVVSLKNAKQRMLNAAFYFMRIEVHFTLFTPYASNGPVRQH
eukprot:1158311-Pelagomonas_calceolata.AAC.6